MERPESIIMKRLSLMTVAKARAILKGKVLKEAR
jgi:hypothetical protein